MYKFWHKTKQTQLGDQDGLMDIFFCGAGSMLLSILILLTPVRVRLERLSAASWWVITALLFIIFGCCG